MLNSEAGLQKSGVGYRDLREYMQLLEAAGLLRRVRAEVNLKHEIGGICARSLERKGPALLFENIKDYPGKSLVSNLISTNEHLALAFNTEPDPDKIYSVITEGMIHRLPSVVVERGPCKEEIHHGEEADLYEIPTPWWHELDGGQYLGTAAGVIFMDPRTDMLNLGTYRCMIVDKNTLTASVRFGTHVPPNEAKGLPTPVAIAVGMDPLLTLASGTPVPPDAQGHMEYEAAGAWRGRPTELVKCETSDLLVPAHAEFIVEGEFLPNVRMPEGPHGEAGGFYGQLSEALAIKVKCITHRKDPIAYGVICLIEEDYPRWLLRSGSFQHRVIHELGLSNVKRVYLPEISARWGAIIVAAEIVRRDEAQQIIRKIWEIEPNRAVIVVDEDCDVMNWNDVMWRVFTCVDLGRDVVRGKRRFRTMVAEQKRSKMDIDSDIPDPMGIDATFRFKFDNLPPINKPSKELMAKVAARWKELDLP